MPPAIGRLAPPPRAHAGRPSVRGGQRVTRRTPCRAKGEKHRLVIRRPGELLQGRTRLPAQRLRRDSLDAEQVQRVPIMRAIAHREIATDGENEVAAAHREEGAAFLHHERAMHVGDDVLRVAGHRVAADSPRRGTHSTGPARGRPRRGRAPSGGPAAPPRRPGPRSPGPDPTSRRVGCEGSRGPRGTPCPRDRRSTRDGPRRGRPRGPRPPPFDVSSAGPPRSKASTADQGRLKSARICARSAISGTQTTALPSRVAHAFMVPSGVAM